MFQKKFRYMTALLAALMITQGSFTAFADETPVGPGYEDQNKASTDTTTSDPASAWKKVNGVYVDANGKNMDCDCHRKPQGEPGSGFPNGRAISTGRRLQRMMSPLRIFVWDPLDMKDSIPWTNIMRKI